MCAPPPAGPQGEVVQGMLRTADLVLPRAGWVTKVLRSEESVRPVCNDVHTVAAHVIHIQHYVL